MGQIAAEILGVAFLSTVSVLLKVLSKHIIKFEELVNILDQMIDLGFRLETKIYRRVLQTAKEIAVDGKGSK